MTQQHPITPPPELVEQWTREYDRMDPRPNIEPFIATRAAEWGADHELEACCEWINSFRCCEWINSFQNKFVHAHDLRLVRRPKPPSLKEQALLALSHLLDGAAHSMDTTEPADYIRRALKQLDD